MSSVHLWHVNFRTILVRVFQSCPLGWHRTPNNSTHRLSASLSGFDHYGGTAIAVRDSNRRSIRFFWLAENGIKNHKQLAEANWAKYLMCLVFRKHCFPLPCLSPHIYLAFFWNCPRSGLWNKIQSAKYVIWYHDDAYLHSCSYNIRIICKFNEREAYDCLRLATYSCMNVLRPWYWL